MTSAHASPPLPPTGGDGVSPAGEFAGGTFKKEQYFSVLCRALGIPGPFEVIHGLVQEI